MQRRDSLQRSRVLFMHTSLLHGLCLGGGPIGDGCLGRGLTTNPHAEIPSSVRASCRATRHLSAHDQGRVQEHSGLRRDFRWLSHRESVRVYRGLSSGRTTGCFRYLPPVLCFTLGSESNPTSLCVFSCRVLYIRMGHTCSIQANPSVPLGGVRGFRWLENSSVT